MPGEIRILTFSLEELIWAIYNLADQTNRIQLHGDIRRIELEEEGGVTARLIDSDVPSPLINLYSVVAALFGSFALALWMGGFSPVKSTADLLWIAGMGGLGGTAVLFLVVSYRMTEQSNLAPFNYFGIPFAFFFGWLVFGEAPFSDLFPGAILIVGSGLLVIWRERRLNRQSTG